MNERIEALKKLATKEVWSENQYNGAPEFDGYELDADMFAELIVAEVITALQKRCMGDNNREDMEVLRCVADMKKTFWS